MPSKTRGVDEDSGDKGIGGVSFSSEVMVQGGSLELIWPWKEVNWGLTKLKEQNLHVVFSESLHVSMLLLQLVYASHSSLQVLGQ